MYLGHAVELGTTNRVFKLPYQPNIPVLSAVPIADIFVEKHILLVGDIRLVMNPPPAAPFQTQCQCEDKVGRGLCDKEVSTVRKFADGRQIKCHLPGSVLDVNTPVPIIVGA